MVRFGNLISIYDFPDLVEQIFINICDMQSRLHEMPQNIHYLQINYLSVVFTELRQYSFYCLLVVLITV